MREARLQNSTFITNPAMEYASLAYKAIALCFQIYDENTKPTLWPTNSTYNKEEPQSGSLKMEFRSAAR